MSRLRYTAKVMESFFHDFVTLYKITPTVVVVVVAATVMVAGGSSRNKL